MDFGSCRIFGQQVVQHLHTGSDIFAKVVAVVGRRIGTGEGRTEGKHRGSVGMAHLAESIVESVSPSRHGASQIDESHAYRESLEPVGVSEQKPALPCNCVDRVSAPLMFVFEPRPELWCEWGSGRRGHEIAGRSQVRTGGAPTEQSPNNNVTASRSILVDVR